MVHKLNYSNCQVLQRPDAKSELNAEQFDLDYWVDKPGYTLLGGGRRATVKISLDGEDAILRRYYRGGMVGKVLTDQYFWLGKSSSRPWREWQVLERAWQAGLPVPKPIAACVCRKRWWYHAAIVTGYLADTETLANRLQSTEVSAEIWNQLGQIIRDVQREGIRHPDLTVTNILIDTRNRLYLIDFDNARIKSSLGDWQWGPLNRLQRSFDKFNQTYRPGYSGDDWQALMDGYQS